jgi:hypothetical protein
MVRADQPFMAAYSGKESCSDCGAPATEYLGRRLPGKNHYYGCKGCSDSRLGRKSSETKIPEPEPTPQPTRVDTFKQGHDAVKYTQASLFDD